MYEDTVDPTREPTPAVPADDPWAEEAPSQRRPLRRRQPATSHLGRDEARIIRLLGSGAKGEDHRTRPLFDRLRNRRIVQWFIGYLAVAWLALQLMQTLAEIWSVPISVQRGISLMLALGTLPTLVIAWYHGELGRQHVCATEVGIVAVMLLTTIAVVWRTCFI